ncbi:hypothetical protein [Rhizobium sp. BK176]|uniref:hypothetical protein n=1 Tax=Rhizobium sp. BK176 TaxID=2587071 RepID=UPI00216902C2|nr:hypothetical protein [Rhizobium sp. BK176]MCS4088482.1 hypothetical protein [Rhizobium sp. BK176]
MEHTVDGEVVSQNVSPPSDVSAASAILRLLMLVAQANDEAKVAASDILFATRTTERDVREVFELLAAADLLPVRSSYRNEEEDEPGFGKQKSFSINLNRLIALFGGEDWRNDLQASRLRLAHDGDGEFCVTGFQGQDADLVRRGYLEVKVTSAFDNQLARITSKGRAVYIVLGLLYPQCDATQGA